MGAFKAVAPSCTELPYAYGRRVSMLMSGKFYLGLVCFWPLATWDHHTQMAVQPQHHYHQSGSHTILQVNEPHTNTADTRHNWHGSGLLDWPDKHGVYLLSMIAIRPQSYGSRIHSSLGKCQRRPPRISRKKKIEKTNYSKRKRERKKLQVLGGEGVNTIKRKRLLVF